MMALNCGRFIGGVKPLFSSFRNVNLQKIVPAAGIISKTRRDPDYKRPPPFPYETKKYTLAHWYMLDGTSKRFDENTSLIVVDGNIGVGKSKLAKQLADELDMKHMPETTIDRIYKTPYGYDLRQLDPIMPPSFKSCTVKKFYEDPYDQNVTAFQFRMLFLRCIEYMEALTHILNTGQGVVMERSVYSDPAFMEAMYLNGYVRKEARDLYMEMFENMTPELMKPCLVIYLDISPELAMQRIRERNDPIEVNSKVLNTNYLADIDNYYKHTYLKSLSKNCEILVYDWSHYGDPEVVVEDIEKIDFDGYEKYAKMLKDWRCVDDWVWSWKRLMYTSRRRKILSYGMIKDYRIHEIYHPSPEVAEYKEIMKRCPGEIYHYGFNKEDSFFNVLFKLRNKRLNDDFIIFRPM